MKLGRRQACPVAGVCGSHRRSSWLQQVVNRAEPGAVKVCAGGGCVRQVCAPARNGVLRARRVRLASGEHGGRRDREPPAEDPERQARRADRRGGLFPASARGACGGAGPGPGRDRAALRSHLGAALAGGRAAARPRAGPDLRGDLRAGRPGRHPGRTRHAGRRYAPRPRRGTSGDLGGRGDRTDRLVAGRPRAPRFHHRNGVRRRRIRQRGDAVADAARARPGGGGSGTADRAGRDRRTPGDQPHLPAAGQPARRRAAARHGGAVAGPSGGTAAGRGLVHPRHRAAAR